MRLVQNKWCRECDFAGQDETVGAKNDPRFELHDPTIVGEPYSSVSLSTPPRNLKLNEDIYSLNENTLEHKLAEAAASHSQYNQNGHVGGAPQWVTAFDSSPFTVVNL